MMKTLWDWFCDMPFSQTREVRVYDAASHNRILVKDYCVLRGDDLSIDYAKVVSYKFHCAKGFTAVYVRL